MTANFDAALQEAVGRATAGAPPRLAAALRHAVFPGGARVRPRLCLAVAQACGNDAPELALGCAVSIEFLHAASLVHDDLPCFDDADIRRGRPSVHSAFGEPTAVLVGDGLIVQAFEAIGHAGQHMPARLAPLLLRLTDAAGTPRGLVAGQAWEAEEDVPLARYHRAKTGALFIAAAGMGALASGADPDPWEDVGARLGQAYQVADDLLDAYATSEAAGKPTGQDVAHDRPNAVKALGAEGALAHLRELIAEAQAAIPAGEGRPALQKLIGQIASRLVPSTLARSAA
jgi:geranylgeranyl diphosphate synthase type II